MFLKKFLISLFAMLVSSNISMAQSSFLCHTTGMYGTPVTSIVASEAACTALGGTFENVNCLQKGSPGCPAKEGLLKACTSGFGSAVFCGMAALTAVQSVQMLTASHKSKKIADQTKCTSDDCNGSGGPGPGYGTPPGGNPGAGTDLTPDEQHALNIATNAIKDLKEKGYTYNPKTNSVNMPDGRSVPASTFSSAEGLRSLGASDDLIASIEQADKKANNNYGSFGYDDGGGGGLRVKKAKGYDDGKGFDMNAYLKSMMDQKNQAGRDVSGLQKQNGSDSIGVAQDDLFKMIHRRYESQAPSLHP